MWKDRKYRRCKIGKKDWFQNKIFYNFSGKNGKPNPQTESQICIFLSRSIKIQFFNFTIFIYIFAGQTTAPIEPVRKAPASPAIAAQSAQFTKPA